MATFDVDIEGKTYEVDAPDANTAWKWANLTHRQAPAKRDIAAEIANDPITKGAEAAKIPNTIEQMGRQTLMTGRHLLGAFGGDIIADKLELPRPENMQERIVGDAARAMAQGSGIASLAGRMAPYLQGVPQSVANLFATNTPTTILANAAGGGAGGMAREGGAGPMGQTAASLGAAMAVPLMSNAGSVALNYAKNNIGTSKSFAARLANQLAGDKRGEILDLLKSQTEGPLGERLTAGQAAAPAGRAEFSGLERVVAPNQASNFDAIQQAQNEARANAIRSFGKDKPTLDAAIEIRGINAAKNYGDAYAQPTKFDPTLAQLMANPFVKDELPAALKLAEANGITPKDDLTQFLHYVKIGLDKQLSKTGNDALTSTQQKSVQDAKTQLLDWLASPRGNPKYELARKVFAEESQPINQMQVGQFLADKLTAPIAEQGAGVSQRGALYAQALRDAPGTLKRSTGMPRYETLDQVLTPEQVATTSKVGASLARAMENERLGGLGAKKAQETMSAIEPPLPSAGMLSPVYSVLRAITNRIHGSVTSKVTETLAKAMQDPKAMAALMESATPAERKALAPYLLTAPILTSGKAAIEGAQQ